jgi:hypothetical protein
MLFKVFTCKVKNVLIPSFVSSLEFILSFSIKRFVLWKRNELWVNPMSVIWKICAKL